MFGFSQHAMVQFFVSAVRTGRFAVASERNVARPLPLLLEDHQLKPPSNQRYVDHGDSWNIILLGQAVK